MFGPGCNSGQGSTGAPTDVLWPARLAVGLRNRPRGTGGGDVKQMHSRIQKVGSCDECCTVAGLLQYAREREA